MEAAASSPKQQTRLCEAFPQALQCSRPATERFPTETRCLPESCMTPHLPLPLLLLWSCILGVFLPLFSFSSSFSPGLYLLVNWYCFILDSMISKWSCLLSLCSDLTTLGGLFYTWWGEENMFHTRAKISFMFFCTPNKKWIGWIAGLTVNKNVKVMTGVLLVIWGR